MSPRSKAPVPVCEVSCHNDAKIAALKNALPSSVELARSAARHKALGHPARLTILHLLSRQECCVCDLAHIMKKPVSTVSQHLQTLKSVGLLESRQQGKLVFYRPVAAMHGTRSRASKPAFDQIQPPINASANDGGTNR